MNFNFLFLLSILVSCGMKGDPINPKGTSLPSIASPYQYKTPVKNQSKQLNKEVEEEEATSSQTKSKKE